MRTPVRLAVDFLHLAAKYLSRFLIHSVFVCLDYTLNDSLTSHCQFTDSLLSVQFLVYSTSAEFLISRTSIFFFKKNYFLFFVHIFKHSLLKNLKQFAF